ncbi:MAG TPA: carbon-nitrogen hydrolase family protein [Armatimonadetes bacterium]|nr:carbon-nitrogen hydrolase family protein [Armatimonadota bacterium]
MARYVRVSTISFPGAGGAVEDRVERARQSASEWLDRAALDRPDIVCLPETFAALGLSNEEWFKTAEPVPGPTTEVLAAKAREYHMYVICPLVEQQGDKVYNSAVLIDREGQILGAYHKIHPTISEIEVGITPGTEPTVFTTDFGQIGCAICYDLNFRQVIEGLKAKGAEMVFFPSMYRGGLQLRIWAYDFGVFVASATPGEQSAIVNPLGRVLVESSNYERIISRRLNLDCRVLHLDYNHPKFEDLKRKYGPAVEIEVATPEASCLLISHHPEVTVEDILREFELEPRDAYLARANAVRTQALSR